MNQLIHDLETLARDCVSPYPEVKPGEEEPLCGTMLMRLIERQDQALQKLPAALTSVDKENTP